jgi:RES domain-containing protein
VVGQRERKLIEAWTNRAKPLSGIYFRSVAYNYMKPEEVLGGMGAAAHGGRFASPGTPAVYLSESDAVARERSRAGRNGWVAMPS